MPVPAGWPGSSTARAAATAPQHEHRGEDPPPRGRVAAPVRADDDREEQHCPGRAPGRGGAAHAAQPDQHGVAARRDLVDRDARDRVIAPVREVRRARTTPAAPLRRRSRAAPSSPCAASTLRRESLAYRPGDSDEDAFRPQPGRRLRRRAPAAGGARGRPRTPCRPTETGSEKRRGPALPGLNQSTPLLLLRERLVRVAEHDHPGARLRAAPRTAPGRRARGRGGSAQGPRRDRAAGARAASAPSRRRRCRGRRSPARSGRAPRARGCRRRRPACRITSQPASAASGLGAHEAVGVGDDADRQPLRHSGCPMRTSSPAATAGTSGGVGQQHDASSRG